MAQFHRSRLSVQALGGIAALLVNLFAVIALWQSHVNVMGRAEQRTDSLAQIFADYAFQTLDTYDQIMVDVQGFVDGDMPAHVDLNTYLRRQKAQHPHILNLFVFNPDGAVTWGTGGKNVDLSDRDYFTIHRDDADIGRYVGRPSLSRITPEKWFFALSRRLSRDDDTFAGVVAATIDLADLAAAFERSRENQRITLALLHQDGTLMLRSPMVESVMGQKVPVPSLEGREARTLEVVSPVDNVLRIITERIVPKYPLVVIASIPKADVLDEWARLALPILGVDIAITLAILAVATRLRRHDEAKEKLLAELATAKDEADCALINLARAQDAMVRNEKMAALGGLVAGIAHEINTPIGNALTSASFLERETRDLRGKVAAQALKASDLQDYMNGADEAVRLLLSNCTRAAELIHGFKQVAVDQTSGERRSFDLAEYMAEIMLSLKPKLRHTPHQVQLDVPAGIVVDSFPGALSQIVTNLVLNSLMHGFEPGKPGQIHISASCCGGMVSISYGDNGKGIPAQLREKVFEPFFTTKRGAGGSGLGLNIVHNIVHRTLGGALEVDGMPGKGVTFRIRFPQTAPAGAEGKFS